MNPEKQPQTVTLTMEQWNKIQDTLSKHDKALYGSPIVDAEKAKFHTVKISFVEEQPVIGFVNRGTTSSPRSVYPGRTDPSRPNEFIEYVDVIVRNPADREKPQVFALPYNDFLRESRKVACKIVSTRIKEIVTQDGVTTGRTFKPDTYIMEERGIVPVIVKVTRRFYTVELPDSTTEEIDEMYVNMA